MIKTYNKGIYLYKGELKEDKRELEAGLAKTIDPDKARKSTMAYNILMSHNKGGDEKHLKITFDSLTSHDITYVGIIQTARASGLKEFPVPYVMTNCHNSLCAVGGTINEDDHKFALSAAHKYGGVYVPANMANIHSFNREMYTGVGRMILGSDSHTRYGALGTMGIGEGGGELAKQLLKRSYDIDMPPVICVYLTGCVRPGVGPHDVALSIVKATYATGFVKNKVMEFVGPGIAALPIEYRNAIDVMTTETTCLSSIWETDDEVKRYYEDHGRKDAYSKLAPGEIAYYDGALYIDLSTIECSIALPMHPSNVYTIHELNENAADILRECEKSVNDEVKGASFDLMSKLRNDGIYADQGEIAGCAGGTFDNILAASDILAGGNVGNKGFTLGIYPGSVPALSELIKCGSVEKLISAGAMLRECFCGPCFGAGECPANGELSIRHTTRNFPYREGSKPTEGQLSLVALMDARSIAASAINGGRITAASDLDIEYSSYKAGFDKKIYESKVYDGFSKAEGDNAILKTGPNIKDWPLMPALSEDLLLKICTYIEDKVTTTDELIPSGETSSYRSNPERLSEFALSKRDPEYVGRAKKVKVLENSRKEGKVPEEVESVYELLKKEGLNVDPLHTNIASGIYATKPGDGSAREQAASCQKVLGAGANIATEYATKRYRSNCINWGMVPFVTDEASKIALNDYVFVPGIKKGIIEGREDFPAYIVKENGKVEEIKLSTGFLTEDERDIIIAGSLINYYKEH